MQKYKIIYMLGYPSSMSTLAYNIIEEGLKTPSLRVVICEGEPLYAHQRDIISYAFKCPVREAYGMTEIVSSASECGKGSLHRWPEVGIIEIMKIDKNEILEAGQKGRFVCTGLFNTDMPLIRYELGDHGALIPENNVCGCGRKLPMLQAIESRYEDSLLTPDGRLIGRIDSVFKGDLAIREAQIIQESLDCIRVRFIPATGYTAQKDGKSIIQNIQERIGSIKILLEPVDEIPRSNSGKFKAVICKVANSQK